MILLTDDQIDLIAERIAAKLQRQDKLTYTVKEAASALNLSTSTVRRMLDAGQLSRLKGTAKPIIPAHEIQRLLTHGR